MFLLGAGWGLDLNPGVCLCFHLWLVMNLSLLAMLSLSLVMVSGELALVMEYPVSRLSEAQSRLPHLFHSALKMYPEGQCLALKYSLISTSAAS